MSTATRGPPGNYRIFENTVKHFPIGLEAFKSAPSMFEGSLLLASGTNKPHTRVRERGHEGASIRILNHHTYPRSTFLRTYMVSETHVERRATTHTESTNHVEEFEGSLDRSRVICQRRQSTCAHFCGNATGRPGSNIHGGSNQCHTAAVVSSFKPV